MTESETILARFLKQFKEIADAEKFKFAVGGSRALTAHGFDLKRPLDDIDIVCNANEKQTSRFWKLSTNHRRRKMTLIDGTSWMLYSFFLNEAHGNVFVKPFLNFFDALEEKEILGSLYPIAPLPHLIETKQECSKPNSKHAADLEIVLQNSSLS